MLARSRPGRYNIAVAGSPLDLAAAEKFQSAAGVTLAPVQYKGAGPAINGISAGQVEMGFFQIGSVLQAINTGKVRAIAVTGSPRSSSLPELPTMAEYGIKGM
jgi:tripartite-type tricarboxylate transporter receptor subunit TctC